jgi:hypothetical protein
VPNPAAQLPLIRDSLAESWLRVRATVLAYRARRATIADVIRAKEAHVETWGEMQREAACV